MGGYLIGYTSSAGGKAMHRALPSDRGEWKLPHDAGGGRPRAFGELSGRVFRRRSRAQNRALQQQGSASERRNLEVATSRVRLLGWCAHYGLAPAPGAEEKAAVRAAEAEVEAAGRAASATKGASGGVPRTRNASSSVTADDARRAEEEEARRLRKARREVRRDDSSTAEGVEQTARLTWRVFECASSRRNALRILACLKGSYVNLYPSPLHRDADDNLESFTILRLSWPTSGGRELERLAHSITGARRNAGATCVPLRGIAIHVRPDRDIGHAFFKVRRPPAGARARAARRSVILTRRPPPPARSASCTPHGTRARRRRTPRAAARTATRRSSCSRAAARPTSSRRSWDARPERFAFELFIYQYSSTRVSTRRRLTRGSMVLRGVNAL